MSRNRAIILASAFALAALTALAWNVTRSGGKTSPTPAAVANPINRHRTDQAPNPFAMVADPSISHKLRIAYLREALANGCGERELCAIYQILAKGPASGELAETWYVVANDLMEQLRLHDPNESRLSSTLLDVLHDTNQPLVLRDYAVQHLASWLNPRSQASSLDSPVAPPPPPGLPNTSAPQTLPGTLRAPEISARVLEAMVAAAMDPSLEQSTIPGTTMMMLVDLSRMPTGVDCSTAITTLKPWLANALRDGSTLSTPCRVSAVQAAAVLAPDEFLPQIRLIAYQKSGQSSLRLPAIGALSQTGAVDDLEKLQQIAREVPDLAYAARDAHRVLMSRLTVAHSQPLPPATSQN